MYDKLVISGGANKVYSVLGALKQLGDKISSVTHFAGTSAGSIVATLLALGIQPDDLVIFYDEIDTLFLEINFYNPITYYRILFNRGIHDPKVFKTKVIDRLIEKACGNKNITFEELYISYSKVLVINGTCLNKRETHYYNYISNPRMKIADAITISCCLPLLFQPIEWKGDTLVDGGILENYPLYYFSDTKSLPNSRIQKVLDKGEPIKDDTLGIRFIDDTTSRDPKKNYLSNDKTSPVFHFIMSLVNSIFTSNERRTMRPDYWEKSVAINLGSFDSISNMVLSSEQKTLLFSKGVEAVVKKFEN